MMTVLVSVHEKLRISTDVRVREQAQQWGQEVHGLVLADTDDHLANRLPTSPHAAFGRFAFFAG